MSTHIDKAVASAAHGRVFFSASISVQSKEGRWSSTHRSGHKMVTASCQIAFIHLIFPRYLASLYLQANNWLSIWIVLVHIPKLRFCAPDYITKFLWMDPSFPTSLSSSTFLFSQFSHLRLACEYKCDKCPCFWKKKYSTTFMFWCHFLQQF